MYGFLDFLMIILSHHCVAILLAKMLIWTPFSQSMCTFSFCINPCIDDFEYLKLWRNTTCLLSLKVKFLFWCSGSILSMLGWTFLHTSKKIYSYIEIFFWFPYYRWIKILQVSLHIFSTQDNFIKYFLPRKSKTKVYSFSFRIGSKHWYVFLEIKIVFSLTLKI